MKSSRVARRYARALFDSAVEQGCLESVEGDLQQLHQQYADVPGFRRVMDSPVVPSASKEELFSGSFQGRVEELTLNFVRLLLRKNREAALPMIIEDFGRLLDEHRGIIRGDLYSVTPFSEEQLHKLKQMLDKKTGKNVLLKQHLQKDLLGGFVIVVDDLVYDSSLRNELSRLQRSLTASSGR